MSLPRSFTEGGGRSFMFRYFYSVGRQKPRTCRASSSGRASDPAPRSHFNHGAVRDVAFARRRETRARRTKSSFRCDLAYCALAYVCFAYTLMMKPWFSLPMLLTVKRSWWNTTVSFTLGIRINFEGSHGDRNSSARDTKSHTFALFRPYSSGQSGRQAHQVWKSTLAPFILKLDGQMASDGAFF